MTLGRYSIENKTAGSGTGSSRKPAVGDLLRAAMSDALRLNDSRRDEEDEFLIGRIHLHVPEQVPQDRDVPQQRHLRDVDRVLRLDDATNHYRPAVGHQYLRSGLL